MLSAYPPPLNFHNQITDILRLSRFGGRKLSAPLARKSWGMKGRDFLTEIILVFFAFFLIAPLPSPTYAAISIPFTVNLSEIVAVDTTGGTPRISVDVGGSSRYAAYTSGSGASALTFTLSPAIGDVDLDGVTLSSHIDLNGGSIKDTKGNDAILTFTPPNTANVKINYPSLGMDFVFDADGRYTLNGTVYNDLPSFLTASGGNFTRNSIATYFDSSGTLQTAPAHQPRFDYDPVTHAAKGLLIEESRTNSLRNSQVGGAITGTPGSPPSNWNYTQPPGIVKQIVGAGIINGYSYIDVRFSGTASTTSDCVLDPEGSTTIVASSGQTWTFSVYIALISGTWPAAPTKPIISIRERDSGGTLVASTDYNLNTAVTTSDLTRVSVTRTLNNPSTVYVSPAIRLTSSVVTGTPIDVTFRVAMPQFEQGVVPTSYIPTTTAAVIRRADVLTLPAGGWFDSNKGTVYSEARTPSTSSFSSTLWSIGDGSTSDFILGRVLASSTSELAVKIGGTATVNQSSVTLTPGMAAKMATAYQLNDFAMAVNNTPAVTSLSGALPTVTSLRAGQVAGVNFLNSTLYKLKYYPARVPNTQLRLMTE